MSGDGIDGDAWEIGWESEGNGGDSCCPVL